MEEDLNEMQQVEIEKKYSPSLRKSNKPLMEKRRRARINSCLSQLKSLVLQAMKKDSSQFSKLEKADILEMTVKHLRQMQRQQIHTTVSSDPIVATKFRSGFSQCANEVLRYLDNAHGVNETMKSRLVGHLSECVHSAQAQEVQVVPLPGQTQTVRPGSLLMPAHTQPPPSTFVGQQDHVNKDTSMSPVATQMAGTFKLIPSNVCNGAVAVYLGHAYSDNQSEISLPVYSIQVPQDNSEHTPQRQPLEHDDICLQTFCNVPTNQKSVNRTISQVCHSAAEAFKQECIWRPW